MSNLMIVPNYNDDSVPYEILSTTDEILDSFVEENYKGMKSVKYEKQNGPYSSFHSIKIYNRSLFHVTFTILHELDLNKYIKFFDLLKIDFDRFLENRIVQKSVKIKEYKAKNIDKTGTIKLKYRCIKPSIVEFLRWKVKDIDFDNIYFTLFDYTDNIGGKLGYNNIITKEKYIMMVNLLEKELSYYTQKRSNSSKIDYLNYNIERLMNMDIKLLSHEELRRRKNEKEKSALDN